MVISEMKEYLFLSSLRHEWFEKLHMPRASQDVCRFFRVDVFFYNF